MAWDMLHKLYMIIASEKIHNQTLEDTWDNYCYYRLLEQLLNYKMPIM